MIYFLFGYCLVCFLIELKGVLSFDYDAARKDLIENSDIANAMGRVPDWMFALVILFRLVFSPIIIPHEYFSNEKVK